MLTPAERSMRSRAAAYARWAKEPDRRAATEAMRQARLQKFIDMTPAHLPMAQRIRMAEAGRRADMARLTLAGMKAKRMLAEANAGLAALELSEEAAR